MNPQPTVLRRDLATRLLGACTVGLALLAAIVLLVSQRRPPIDTMVGIVREGLLSPLGLTDALVRAIPVLWCALAVALPARIGLLNLGGEGQFFAGAIGATAVVLAAPEMGRFALLSSMAIAAAVAGALWALVAAFLRARLSVNEVLTSLMLNYVASLALLHLVHGPWKDPRALGWPYSRMFPDAAVLPRFGTTNIHGGLVAALGGTLLLAGLAAFAVWGYETRLLGHNQVLARRSGVSPVRHIIIAMLAAGAMAGLAGLGEVSVVQQRLRPGISSGFGYLGFLASFLAGNRFWAIPFVTLGVGVLYAGVDALQLSAGLPSTTADVFIGLVFLGALGARSAWRPADREP